MNREPRPVDGCPSRRLTHDVHQMSTFQERPQGVKVSPNSFLLINPHPALDTRLSRVDLIDCLVNHFILEPLTDLVVMPGQHDPV